MVDPKETINIENVVASTAKGGTGTTSNPSSWITPITSTTPPNSSLTRHSVNSKPFYEFGR